MKISAISLLIATTLLLVTVTIFVLLRLPFGLIFYLTVLGQGLLIVTVYKVLTDDYKTDKSFEDFYEDHPIGREEGHIEEND